MYVIRNYPPVTRMIEGVKVVGTGAIGLLKEPWDRGERYRIGLVRKLFRRNLQTQFRKFRADFILCLDPGSGYEALNAGLPYAMRFHSRLIPEHLGENFEELLKKSLFNISGPTTGAVGIEELPHNQDLTRFIYKEPEKPERAILLTSIDDVHEPELFIEGIMLSESMKGDIVGTGPYRRKIEAICSKTGGRVRCLAPVPRLKVPELLNNYQVGVATVKKISEEVYQMKVNAYMASGLFTLVKPWTHIAKEAPDLIQTFITAGEMSEKLNHLQKNWAETLQTRRNAREWIHRHYSVDIPRKRFNEILREKVAPSLKKAKLHNG